MLTPSEILGLFTPILLFAFVAFVVCWQIAKTAKGKVRGLTISALLIWILLTLLFCVFTLGYISPHVGGNTSRYFVGVLTYGIIGLGLVLLARSGNKNSQ